MEKEQKKADKIKQKNFQKLMKKAGIKKGSTQAEIDEKIIEYVKNLKKDFDKIILNDSQHNNPQFLLALYKANNEMIYWQKPNSQSEGLQNNVDFMIEYVKLAFYREIKCQQTSSQETLNLIIQDYKKAMTNPEFIERLLEEFPKTKLISLLKHQKNKLKEQDFKNMLEILPKEMLCNQARIYGESFVCEMPKDLTCFTDIVSAGIERDGFKSLSQLDVEQLLNNKSLVIKACQKDNEEEFANYIMFSLSPLRTSYDHTTGKEGFLVYDKRYLNVQKALIEDDEIQTVIRGKKLKTNKTENLKQNNLNRNENLFEEITSE